MPKISVVIPVYNTEKYLPECLESVINQTFKDIEIICVNDGSTDNSQKILEEYAEKDSRIRVIKQENKGVIEARNRAIKEAKGIYIYPLDSDDIIDHRTLDILYQAIFAGKGDVITSRVVYFGKLWQEFVLPKPNKYNLAYANCLVNAALFRKKDFIESGGYNPEYKTVLEDYDLWLNFVFRLKKKIYRVPEVLFFYRMKDAQESRNSADFSVHEKIRKSFVKKYPQIKFYQDLRQWNEKIFKILIKVGRFFFRIQKNHIKIFKFPVYELRHKVPFLYFFETKSNFGDQLNRDLFDYFTKEVNLVSDFTPKCCDILAIGSLLQLFITQKKPSLKEKYYLLISSPLTVYGSGFIEESKSKNYSLRKMKVKAVRGYLSLERLKKLNNVSVSKNVAIGDPGLLISKFFDVRKVEKKYNLGIIPHYVDQNNPLLKKINVKNSIVLDITKKPEELIYEIAACRNIISSAMHGLIAADSLGIPNIRMILSDKIVGGDYKFNDYYSAFGIEKHNRINLNEKSFTDADLPMIAENYVITKDQVEKIQNKLIQSFPYKNSVC